MNTCQHAFSQGQLLTGQGYEECGQGGAQGGGVGFGGHVQDPRHQKLLAEHQRSGSAVTSPKQVRRGREEEQVGGEARGVAGGGGRERERERGGGKGDRGKRWRGSDMCL